jgi:hypothetical protein
VDPRYLDIPLVAKIDGSGKELLVRRVRPKIQLVPLRTALEATVVVLGKIGREFPPSSIATTSHRTNSIDLRASNGGGNESQEFEHLLHGDHQSHRMKIDPRHGVAPQEEYR